jgi:hypothetical protein
MSGRAEANTIVLGLARSTLFFETGAQNVNYLTEKIIDWCLLIIQKNGVFYIVSTKPKVMKFLVT